MSADIAITLIAVAVLVTLLAQLVIDRMEARAARRRLQGNVRSVSARSSVVESVFRPVFSLYAPLLSRFSFPTTRERLTRRFVQADLEDYTPEEFWAFQIFAAMLFSVFVYVLTLELRLLDLDVHIPLLVYPVIMLAGFFFPYVWIDSLIKRRRREIVLEFPPFVANLTLTVEAGLDFIAAVHRIVRKMKPSALQGELTRMMSEIRIGSTRAEALRNFSHRIGATEISTFTLVLIQADRLGTSIGKVLRVQAERLRRERFELAERKGALASQKLLFPLIFFIMPAVFIIIFGPLIVKLVTGGFQGLIV